MFDRFYTDSTDKRGHCVGRRVTFPPGIVSQMDRIVQSGTIPAYKTSQDIIRDAVVRLLQQLESYEPSPIGTLMLAAAELQASDREFEEIKSIVYDMKEAARAGRISEEQLVSWVEFSLTYFETQSPRNTALVEYLSQQLNYWQR